MHETSVKRIPNPTSPSTSGTKFSVPTDCLGRGIQWNNAMEKAMRERLPINGVNRTKSLIQFLNKMVFEKQVRNRCIIWKKTVKPTKMPNINSMITKKAGNTVAAIRCKLLACVIARDKIGCCENKHDDC